jgi:septum formation protein
MDCDDPIICVKENALIKGEDVAKKYPNALVISADTIVVFEKHILGKPKNEQNAFEMLKTLSANKHCVYTAFALFHRKYDQFLVDVVKTDVFFKKISDEEILSYLSTGEPFDKAGAYAIQGQGAIFIDKIEGCYTNVVGLPTSRLYSKLNEFFDQFIL